MTAINNDSGHCTHAQAFISYFLVASLHCADEKKTRFNCAGVLNKLTNTGLHC